MDSPDHDIVAADRRLALATATDLEAVATRAVDLYDEGLLEEDIPTIDQGGPTGPGGFDPYDEQFLADGGPSGYLGPADRHPGPGGGAGPAVDGYDTSSLAPPDSPSALNFVDGHPHSGLMPEEFILAEQFDQLRTKEGW
ncbi:hypothetical protein [Plantactinospora sp. DSM 117369]